MEQVIETLAKIIFEEWGGPWVAAPEFRKVQARREALTVLEDLRADTAAAKQLIDFLSTKDMGDLSAA